MKVGAGSKELASALIDEQVNMINEQGLVPNVKRDKNNRRVFDDKDVAFLKGLEILCNKDISYQKICEKYVETA